MTSPALSGFMGIALTILVNLSDNTKMYLFSRGVPINSTSMSMAKSLSGAVSGKSLSFVVFFRNFILLSAHVWHLHKFLMRPPPRRTSNHSYVIGSIVFLLQDGPPTKRCE